MDRKARDIIGLPVVTFNRGTKACDVEDMILDPARPQVLALVVEEKAWFHSARVIPFGYISAIGPDAVIVPDGKAIVDLDRLKDKALRSLYNEQTVRGLRVLTDDGRRLGTISDMLIDTKTGEVKGYYMSIGTVLDVTQGTRYLPAASVISMGRRVLYVSPETADELEAQVGGWSGALDQAGGKLREAGARANEGLLSFGDQVKQSGTQINEQLGRYGDQLRDQLPARTQGMLLGRTAHQTVKAPDGTVIVNEGDTINQDNVDSATQAGRLPQLMMAAGAGPTREHWENFSNEASDTWERTRSEARNLWDQLLGRHSQGADIADERILQRRIKNALGRPVDRVILDQDDNIILNTGDIITNRAIEEARDAGVLDILVNSVYTQAPQLTLEDLKAPRSGDASLENVAKRPRRTPARTEAPNTPTATTSGTATGDTGSTGSALQPSSSTTEPISTVATDSNPS